MKPMRAFITASVFAVTSLLPCISHAGYWTGNDLKNWLDAGDRVVGNRALGTDYQSESMLAGFVGGVSSALEGWVLCVPTGVTIGQLEAMVKKYLLANPEKWNQDAAGLVVLALVPAFACKRK